MNRVLTAPTTPPEDPPENPPRLDVKLPDKLPDRSYLFAKHPSNSLASHSDRIAITFTRAVATSLEVGVVGVWAPLNFLGTCPLAGSCATSMGHVLGTFGAEGADVGILWVSLLDINKLSSTDTCNLDSIAVTTCPAMLLVLLVHELVAIPRPPLDFLPLLRSPPFCASTTSV